MNKYELTLKKINHGKNLEFMCDPMKVTKDQAKAKELYHTKKLEDYTAKDLTVMLNNEIEPEHLIELALEILVADKRKGHYDIWLINAVSKQNTSYWKNHPEDKKIFVDLLNNYEVIVSKARYFMGLINDDEYKNIKELGDGFLYKTT